MDADNKNINAELIGKYLAGEASPEEAMQLEDWLAHAENKKEFEHYAQLWNLMPASSVVNVPPSQEVWLHLQRNIDDSRKQVPSRRFLTRMAVAASIIGGIAIVATYFIYQKYNYSLNKYDLTAVIHKANNEKEIDTLKDGSIITLNKHSTISYAPDFNDSKRELAMRGEVFFNVAPNKLKPFIIMLDELKIEVVGTSFNVRKLPINDEIEVQVRSGIVKMYTNRQSLMVKKGQTGIYVKKDNTFKLKEAIDVNSIGYATNSFYFNDISLLGACQYLSNSFNVEIKIDANKFKDCRLTAEFDNKSLAYILEVIDVTFGTSHQQEGNIITINGNGCK